MRNSFLPQPINSACSAYGGNSPDLQRLRFFPCANLQMDTTALSLSYHLNKEQRQRRRGRHDNDGRGRFSNLEVLNEHPPGRNSARCLSYPSIQVETAASRSQAEGQRAQPSRAPYDTLYFVRTKVCREDPRHLVVQRKGIGKCGKSKLQQSKGSKWLPHRAADLLRNKKAGMIGEKSGSLPLLVRPLPQHRD
jgi:hypothetical protein